MPLARLRGAGCAGALLASGGCVFGQGAVPELAPPPGLTAPPVTAPPSPPRAVAPAPVAPAARTVPLALARYNGSYFVIPERSDSTILAINPVVKRLPWFVRGVARNRLNCVNPPCTSVQIRVIDPHTIAIGTDQWPTWQHKLGGPAVRWRRNAQEQYDVSLRLSPGGLEQHFAGVDGERINRYVLSEHGTVLQMEVLVISPKLPQAVYYTLVFART